MVEELLLPSSNASFISFCFSSPTSKETSEKLLNLMYSKIPLYITPCLWLQIDVCGNMDHKGLGKVREFWYFNSLGGNVSLLCTKPVSFQCAQRLKMGPSVEPTSSWVRFWLLELTCQFFLISMDIFPKFDCNYQTHLKSSLPSSCKCSFRDRDSGILPRTINHSHSACLLGYPHGRMHLNIFLG